MKLPHRSRLLRAFFAFLFGATHLFAISPNELRDNPLWQPATTTLKREVRLGSGRVFPTGYRAKLESFDGTHAIVGSTDGTSRFKMELAGITLLEDATKLHASLTPEQRKLTPRSIRETPALWPYTVTLTNTVQLGGGESLQPGTKLILARVDGDSLLLISHELRTQFTIPVSDTDFNAACLKAVVNPPAPRIFQELAGVAIDTQTRSAGELLKDGGPDYVAVYFAANWCPYSTEVSPEVSALFNGLAASGDERIRLVLISNDRSPAEFRTHLNKLDVKGYAVQPNDLGQLVLLRSLHPVTALPTLYVVDRAGKIAIAKSLPNTVEATREVLQAIKAL